MTGTDSSTDRPDLGDDGESSSTSQTSKASRWRCLNCGQQVFVELGHDPPDVCQFCSDMTTWQWIHPHGE